jgi:hypothetical protein
MSLINNVDALTYTVDQSSHGVETCFVSKLEWTSLEFLISRVGVLSDERRLNLETPETELFWKYGFYFFLYAMLLCTTVISKKVTSTVGKKL